MNSTQMIDTEYSDARRMLYKQYIYKKLSYLLNTPGFDYKQIHEHSFKVLLMSSYIDIIVTIAPRSNDYINIYGFVIETSLVDADNRPMLDADLGYDTSRQWTSLEELINELHRLRLAITHRTLGSPDNDPTSNTLGNIFNQINIIANKPPLINQPPGGAPMAFD
jgi:hypothetical protein